MYKVRKLLKLNDYDEHAELAIPSANIQVIDKVDLQHQSDTGSLHYWYNGIINGSPGEILQ